MKPIAPESWLRLRALLDGLLELDAGARGAFLGSLQGTDATLRPELERLLAESSHLAAKPLPSALELAAPSVAAELQGDIDADQTRVGQHVGPYRLVSLLGTGGMGVVYLAEREAGEFTHQVALKLMRQSFASASAKDRFDRERQILAGLKHPGIALLFDGGHTADGQSFYTMEYVDGEPVTDYCARKLDDVEGRVSILLQIASALAHAHQNLIVHRDIKPSNVLVDANGKIKLVDFGLAKALQKSVSPIMTQAGTMPMTPAYAAPEQFHSDAITIATDIYQFGVLAFMVLAERLPYRADPGDSLAWARAVTEDSPMTLARAFDIAHPDAHGVSKIRRQLARDLDAILGKAMAKAPEQRYGSMDAMISDLEAFLDGRPVTARRAGTAYYVWRFAARHRYAVAATIAALLALTATALIAVRQAHIADAEADRANAVATFMVGLFQVSDPSVNRGESLNANQILEKGAARIDRDMATQPEQRARLQSVIGEVYAVLGDYGRSRAALDPAIATLSVVPSKAPIDLAHALGWRAFIAATEGDYKGALTILDRAEGLLDGNTPRQKDELATLHSRRASAYQHLDDYANARREHETALKLREELGQQGSFKTAGIHNNLGTMLRAVNELARARTEFEKAVYIADAQTGNPDKDYLAVGARTNLATVLIDLGELDRAEAMLQKASASLRDMNGPSNVGYANAENKLGEIARLRGLYAAAFDHFTAAEQAYRSALGDHNHLVASPMQNRGEAFLEQARYDDALEQFDRALALRLESLPRTHRTVASALDGRAQALLGLGRYNEAKADAEEALAIWSHAVPSNHPLIVYALFHVGQARSALGDVAGTQAVWREALQRAPLAFVDNPARLKSIREAMTDSSGASIRRVPAGTYDE